MLALIFLVPYLGSGALCYLLALAESNRINESKPRKRLILFWIFWLVAEINNGSRSRFFFKLPCLAKSRSIASVQ